MRRRVLLLAVCGLCAVPFVHGSSRVSDQAAPQQLSSAVSESPVDSRCAAKFGGGGGDCAGEKWNVSTQNCECAPSGTCSHLF
jgi:hypothetical protein